MRMILVPNTFLNFIQTKMESYAFTFVRISNLRLLQGWLSNVSLTTSVMVYPLELRSCLEDTDEMPFPAGEISTPSQNDAYIRPALSEVEMSNLTDEDLQERDYPPRPDSIACPGGL